MAFVLCVLLLRKRIKWTIVFWVSTILGLAYLLPPSLDATVSGVFSTRLTATHEPVHVTCPLTDYMYLNMIYAKNYLDQRKDQKALRH